MDKKPLYQRIEAHLGNITTIRTSPMWSITPADLHSDLQDIHRRIECLELAFYELTTAMQKMEEKED